MSDETTQEQLDSTLDEMKEYCRELETQLWRAGYQYLVCVSNGIENPQAISVQLSGMEAFNLIMHLFYQQPRLARACVTAYRTGNISSNIKRKEDL